MPEQIFLKNDSQEHSIQQQFILHLVQVQNRVGGPLIIIIIIITIIIIIIIRAQGVWQR